MPLSDRATHWLPGLLPSGVSVGRVLPSLSGAAVGRLPVEHFAVGRAVELATRQIGTVPGVAAAGPRHSATRRPRCGRGIHAALALLTGLLCLR